MTKNAPRDQKRRPLKSRKYYALLFIGAALVSGCQVNGTTNIAEGIGFRQARFVEVQAMNLAMQDNGGGGRGIRTLDTGLPV